jgi:hypothetical protein
MRASSPLPLLRLLLRFASIAMCLIAHNLFIQLKQNKRKKRKSLIFNLHIFKRNDETKWRRKRREAEINAVEKEEMQGTRKAAVSV